MFPLLVIPPTVTLTGPVLATEGTTATICVSDQLTMLANILLKVTAPPLWVAPNPVPFICTCVPTGALEGFRELMTGLGSVKITSVLLLPLKVFTVTAPVDVFPGTVATICVSLQLTTGTPTLLTEILPLPPLVDPDVCVGRNPVPVTVICVPAAPLAGETLVTCGGGTVNTTFPGLLIPDTVTKTVPVDAGKGTVATIWLSDQLVAVAVIPPICNVLEH